MTATAWRRWTGPGIGLALLAVLVARFGAEPFAHGLSLTNPVAVLAALAITAVTTACCAWRWRVVAAALAVPVGARVAFAAYYRSQLLNATLPAGVLGDVDRAVGQGRRAGRLGAGLRSVAWERGLGQCVQVTLTVAVVLLVPSPLRPGGWWGPGAAGLVLAGLVLLVRVLPRPLLRERRWVPIAVASAVAAAGHVVIFLVAVAAAGVPVSPVRMLPVACVVLLAASVPANLAGWGPREGAAAWAFGAVGLSPTDGLTVAVVYGVLALVATLPGLLVLVRTGPATAPAPARTEAVGV